MNKAITDGLQLMPPKFADGLGVWSSQDGTPGSDTYLNASNAAFVPADQDFSGCLEINKTITTTQLRYMGETPILPGCYLQVKARVKAVSGNLPSVRIAAWAGNAQNQHVNGLVEVGPPTQLTAYGEVVEVSAIIGFGNRTGVDMIWTPDAIYGHIGLDFTGPNGGVVRVDDLIIEDATSVFHRTMMDIVDVRDFGAIGDGQADDSAAFEAADGAASGRTVLVSAGQYFLGDHVTIDNRIRFEGTVSMPVNKRLALLKNYDLPTYIDAFGDEEEAFRKAFQALLNNSDHESLDMGGRRVQLSGPIDMQAAVENKTTFAIRRVIRNGQLEAVSGPAWDTDVVTSQASYSSSNPTQLTNVANVANIQPGSLVEGAGVGREIYVKSVNVGAAQIVLSAQLYDAAGTQNYTFSRFKYLIDLNGFTSLSRLIFDDIDFQCSGVASGILLPNAGAIFQVRDSYFTKPKNRAISSPGRACQGMMIDRCQFLSDESPLKVQDRISVVLNANANDVKLRDNRVVHFKHFAVLGGRGTIISNNHWFMGDNEVNGLREAGVIFTYPNPKSTITGNYIDNNFVQMTNEHDATPNFLSQFSFGGLTITGNTFTASDVAPWFKFVVIKPYGTGHFINGLNISNNVFRALAGAIDRVEGIDTTFANLDLSRTINLVVEGNTFNSVSEPVFNPVTFSHEEASDTQDWVATCSPHLPFGGHARRMEAFVMEGPVQSGGQTIYSYPYCTFSHGSSQDEVKLSWGQPCRGKVQLTVRADRLVL